MFGLKIYLHELPYTEIVKSGTIGHASTDPDTDQNPDLNLAHFPPVWRIRIRGIRNISLDPDPYKKMPGSGSVSNDTDLDPTKTIENIK